MKPEQLFKEYIQTLDSIKEIEAKIAELNALKAHEIESRRDAFMKGYEASISNAVSMKEPTPVIESVPEPPVVLGDTTTDDQDNLDQVSFDAPCYIAKKSCIDYDVDKRISFISQSLELISPNGNEPGQIKFLGKTSRKAKLSRGSYEILNHMLSQFDPVNVNDYCNQEGLNPENAIAAIAQAQNEIKESTYGAVQLQYYTEQNESDFFSFDQVELRIVITKKIPVSQVREEFKQLVVDLQK